MDLIIAAALLVYLLAWLGKKKRASQSAPKKTTSDKLDWIDKLELYDAATDDFEK